MLKLTALLLSVGATLGAQSATPTTAATPMSDLSTLWTMAMGNVLKSATQVPDSIYAFKPTSSVRTYGQILAHVAGSQHMFCAAALGEKGSAEDSIEKTKTTKADIVAALKESNEHCAKAYALSEQGVSGHAELFGQHQSKRFWLLLNASHDMEHYGNLVTYMRINGITPPSSQGR